MDFLTSFHANVQLCGRYFHLLSPPHPLGDAIPRPKGDASICSLGEHLVERQDSQAEGGSAEQEQQQAQQASTEEDPTQQGQEKEGHDDDAGVSFNVGAVTSEIGQEVKEDAEGRTFLNVYAYHSTHQGLVSLFVLAAAFAPGGLIRCEKWN